MLSRICEEFGCPPDVAIRQPLRLSLLMIEMRQYARVKAACEQAGNDQQMPKGPLADLVFEFEHEQIKARQARQRARLGLDR